MTNIQDLDKLLKSESKTFQRFAVKLYLEALKNRLFEEITMPVVIFKWVHDKIEQYSPKMFAFIAEFQEMMAQKNLDPAQTTFLYNFLKEYAEAAGNEHKFYLSQSYRELFAPYFATLAKIDQETCILEALGQADPTKKVHETIQRQMLLLAGEMQSQPFEVRIKSLAALVKITAQYERIQAARHRSAKKEQNQEEGQSGYTNYPANAPTQPTSAAATPKPSKNPYFEKTPVTLQRDGEGWPHLPDHPAIQTDDGNSAAA